MALNCTSNEAIWALPPEILHINSHEEFAAVQQVIQDAITKTARLHPYNTLNTFVRFYQAYRGQKELTLEQFVRTSEVKNEDGNRSCVGLCCKLMEYVKEEDPTLGRYLYLAVSCDIELDTPDPILPPSAEAVLSFEHVIAVLAFDFKGRKGYVFADMGLHVQFPLVIMADSQWPHTGLFVNQSFLGNRESHVRMVGDTYAVWNQLEFKPDGEKLVKKRYVYLERRYLLLENVDRRAYVISFHGHFLIGTDGFKAGFYIILGNERQRFYLSVPDESGKVNSVFLPYDFFCTERDVEGHSQDDLEAYEALEVFANLCGVAGKDALMKRFRALSETCMDTGFVEELVTLNDRLVARANSEFRAAAN